MFNHPSQPRSTFSRQVHALGNERIGLNLTSGTGTYGFMKPAVKGTLIAGIVCTLGAPFAGLFFTVVGMVGAFHTLGQNGISDPQALSTYIGLALVATSTGLIVGVIFGVPLILAAVVLHFATRTPPPAP